MSTPLDQLLKRMKRASEHPEIDEKGQYVPGTMTEDEAAERGYVGWSSVWPAKQLTKHGAIREAYDASRDLRHSPGEFPGRLRGRLEQYTTRGPDINQPAYTYPYRGSEETPYRVEGDRIRAQRAAADWLAQPPKPSRRKRVPRGR